MGTPRFLPSGDVENNSQPRRSPSDLKRSQRKRKKAHLPDDEEGNDMAMEEGESSVLKKNNKNMKREEPDPASDSENVKPVDLETLSVGVVVRVSGKGKRRRSHYESFEYDGVQFQLEDPVLLVPEDWDQKPYVAIIKDIFRTCKGEIMVTAQWFYRPEEAEKEGGGNWGSSEPRELFYSFHRSEVAAESVMHKCVAHFIPENKKIPLRKEHPGFIVQRVYDTKQRRLLKLTDKGHESDKQHEIDLLVQKTFELIGDLPDLEP